MLGCGCFIYINYNYNSVINSSQPQVKGDMTVQRVLARESCCVLAFVYNLFVLFLLIIIQKACRLGSNGGLKRAVDL